MPKAQFDRMNIIILLKYTNFNKPVYLFTKFISVKTVGRVTAVDNTHTVRVSAFRGTPLRSKSTDRADRRL